jgi:UDP-N-acetylglucosamine 2-epimerase (non-hydrolysing)
MKQRRKIMTVFGTRPEAIKLAPVIHELERRSDVFETVNISSGQHRQLVRQVVTLFQLRIDHDFELQRHDQQPDDVSDRVTQRLIPHLKRESPDILLVQGDTSTAVGAAAAGALMRITVGHIEAGLRSGDEMHPFPEEIYRKRITELASFHFAPTLNNRSNLLSEGVPDSRIFVTGNTIVDSLMMILRGQTESLKIARILSETSKLKRIVLTMHRRENIPQFERVFLALRRFVRQNKDVCLLFPVHPNPAVRQAAEIFQSEARIQLLEPLGYSDFIRLLLHAWTVVTDSGGIQEEAPTLSKAVLLFRAKTERPEALASGMVRLVGDSPDELLLALDNLKVQAPLCWSLRSRTNPFGNGGSAQTIVSIVESLLEGTHESTESTLFQTAQRKVIGTRSIYV